MHEIYIYIESECDCRITYTYISYLRAWVLQRAIDEDVVLNSVVRATMEEDMVN